MVGRLDWVSNQVGVAIFSAISTAALWPLSAVAAPPPSNFDLAQTPAPSQPPPEERPFRDPIPDLVRPDPDPTPTPVDPALPPAPDLAAPEAAPTDTVPEVPGTIVVERFNLVGNTVFPTIELEALVAPFLNREITFPELLQARSAITQHYVEKGYITSGAFVPAGQRLVDGTVTIQIVEGQLEAINITGLKNLNDSYVASRIRRAAGSPLNVTDLVEGLQLLQLDPRVETIAAELATGTQPGQSILDVAVTQTRNSNVLLQVDNGRSPSVGSFRQRIGLSQANLFDGIGDEFNFLFTNTNGSEEYQFRYSVPLTPSNTRLTLSFRDANSRVTEEPFDVLDITSNSDLYELTLVQPVLETPNESISLGLTFSHQDSETFLLGEPFSFTPGLGDDNTVSVSALRFFQEWTRRSQKDVFAARSSFNVGIDVFDATENDFGPDSDFFSWQGQFQYVRRLAPDTLLLLRANFQIADRPLLGLEQFGTGGAGSVRGYRQDTLITDNGYFASAEVRIPIARISKWDGVMWIAPFFDYGKGTNNGDNPNPSEDTLISIGASLRWQIADWFQANLDYGIPLVDLDLEENTLQEEGFLFSVTIQPLKF